MKKKVEFKMDDSSNVLINASEFIKRRLFFVTLNTTERPKSTPCAHYFSTDNDLTYDNFYSDFGPLNLSMLHTYCMRLHRKLNSSSLMSRKIVHYTGPDDEKRVNAAYLIGSYAIIYLKMEPDRVYDILCRNNHKDYLQFRDVSIGEPHTISLLDCLKAVKKAFHYGFVNFSSFDYMEYEYYERVEMGDLNWILPNKFVAFCGPHNRSVLDKGYPVHSPETYFTYFRRNNVNTIVRLNKKVYDSNRFVDAGFDHLDLYFDDGGTPSDRIVQSFLNACETKKGGIAVHCKAGLGRTGTLIACYIIKHYKFTAKEAIAWIRICRPGSVIGHQQTWLQQQESALWKAGDEYRKSKGLHGPIKHSTGIYSLDGHTGVSKIDQLTRIMRRVDFLEPTERQVNYKSEENKPTQGDKLKEIKAQRARAKPLTNNLSEHKSHSHCSKLAPSTILPNNNNNRVANSVRNIGTTSTTKVLTKRNETMETTRRLSQRKIGCCTHVSKPLSVNKTENKRQPRVKENIGWPQKTESVIEKGGADKEEKASKRTKRALNLEKEKPHSRSVKVLRFSPGQASHNDKMNICLPVVKLSKTF